MKMFKKAISVFCSLLIMFYVPFLVPSKTPSAYAYDSGTTGVNFSTMQQYGLNSNSYFWKKAIWTRTNSGYAKDVVTRPYPRLIGNQWNVLPDGSEDNGDTNKYQDYAAKYFDYIYLNRVRGSYSDKFIDTYDSINNPNMGLLKYRNNVYAKAQNYGRRCYVLVYHAQEGIENYSPPTSGYNYWFHDNADNPWATSSNKGTWDLMGEHNGWYKTSSGGYVQYTHYSTSQRRIFDHRNADVRAYWAGHAHNAAKNFDGIFADNWLRSCGSDSSGWRKGVNQAGAALKSKWGSSKILIGNGFYSSDYNARDFGMLEDWTGNWVWDFSQSDAFANAGQLTQDTSAKSSYGSLWDRLARNLMTDDVFGIHDDENGGVVAFVDNYISKLGKIGYPIEERQNNNGVYSRRFTHGIAYWNNSGSTRTVNVPSGLYKDINGTNIEGSRSLSNHQGLILKTRSNTPTPEPTPTPDPTPIPTPDPTPDISTPTTPSSTSVTGVAQGATSGNYYVNLTWNDNSNNETGFEILHGVNSTTNLQVIKTPAANTTEYNINIGNNPTAGTHYFAVRALKDTVKSELSNFAQTSINSPTPTPKPVPDAPGNLSVRSVSKGTTSGDYYVTLDWVDNSDNETGFEIYQAINSTDNYTLAKTTGNNTATYNINV
ncbi:MAG: putative glycoside hydrolase, partial [Candidatus Gastranaerophilales bacterium]|nr:putative glycoside hydrolase [Candidatus Gastranaerophilales bacterium]